MALADDIPFSAIENRFGITEPRLKIHMKQWLKPASYRAWRKRVARFRNQRTVYKALKSFIVTAFLWLIFSRNTRGEHDVHSTDAAALLSNRTTPRW